MNKRQWFEFACKKIDTMPRKEFIEAVKKAYGRPSGESKTTR
ncbi:hypothetical protein [Erwinia phage FBB1]|nr:hypothetical protein [Erwinia phage FBB1]